MNRVLYILFIVLSLSGCKMQMANMGVEEALSKAGGNRKELFQVIRHYQDSGDSLKLKAALFLIENMADKYYLTGNVIDEYDVKTINKLIRSLFKMFECRSYVGYTATPYANIFIPNIAVTILTIM